MQVKITKTINLPDPRRLELCRRSPDLGPNILFFTGGSALRPTSEELIFYTHNSTHIITPVDSGGSSAKLRDAFAMPAIGDIRNRLMALADRGLTGNPEIFRLFAHRFPKDADRDQLERELVEMINGSHPLVERITDPMRKIIRMLLSFFYKRKPSDFDLRAASIGNLILTGGYLQYNHHLDPVIYIFSKLVNVRGTVRPVLDRHLHLVAELESRDILVGQHLLTGKEVPPISSAVKRVFLSESRETPWPVDVAIPNKIKKLIRGADLICYPMGSFFSSIISNLLPGGVGDAIAANKCPKIFIPNTGTDPELYGTDLGRQVEILLHYLKGDNGGLGDEDVLNFILIDERSGGYDGFLDQARLQQRGIHVIDCRLVSLRSRTRIDEKLLVPTLLSLA
jgi:CofD-related protein of GAK system